MNETTTSSRSLHSMMARRNENLPRLRSRSRKSKTLSCNVMAVSRTRTARARTAGLRPRISRMIAASLSTVTLPSPVPSGTTSGGAMRA